MEVLVFSVLISAVFVAGQRPFYAGIKPIGVYVPVDLTTTTESLGDRVGEVTTRRLPIEANGDWELVDRLSKLPIDNQPFWLINWLALEEHRKNPQTYPQRPNTFINPIVPAPTANSNSEFQTVNSNSNFELGTSDSSAINSASTVSNYVITTNANSGSSNDNFVTNSPSTNSVILTTTEIRSTKFENNDLKLEVTSSVPSSDSEFITEDPTIFSSSMSSSSLPPS